jgi:phenylpyruvate tautomerase PptA (4-oxalocrotonate tautomerase family)
MPMIKLHTAKKVTGDLLVELSSVVAEATGKPVRYVMAVAERADTTMGGEECDAVYAEVKGIGGMDGAMNRKISAGVCELIETRLGIPPDRVYIVFEPIPADRWGWNGSTFG